MYVFKPKPVSDVWGYSITIELVPRLFRSKNSWTEDAEFAREYSTIENAIHARILLAKKLHNPELMKVNKILLRDHNKVHLVQVI